VPVAPFMSASEKSDKFFRAYEKGFELAGKVAGMVVTAIMAILLRTSTARSSWKAESRPHPWGGRRASGPVLAEPSSCADVLPGVEADIPLRRPERAPQTDLVAMLEHCCTQYGNVLHGPNGLSRRHLRGVEQDRSCKDHNEACWLLACQTTIS
jgi:hypothetical protein